MAESKNGNLERRKVKNFGIQRAWGVEHLRISEGKGGQNGHAAHHRVLIISGITCSLRWFN